MMDAVVPTAEMPAPAVEDTEVPAIPVEAMPDAQSDVPLVPPPAADNNAAKPE